MDDFKRCYSNEDESKSIPYFWEKFDPENYSIWYAEYKYPEELAKVFMSCNLITGQWRHAFYINSLSVIHIFMPKRNESPKELLWISFFDTFGVV